MDKQNLSDSYISILLFSYKTASPIAQLVKYPPADAEDTGDVSSAPGLGRSPGEGNAIHSSRGAWWVTVHGVAENQPRPSACIHTKRKEVLIHAATWMNLENMLSERSQLQKRRMGCDTII